MKNIYLLFTIFLYSLLSLETSYSQYSHHIPTLTKPGEGLRGYIIFEPQHQSNAFNISLMKYVNMDNSDSIIAVLLSGHIRLDGTGDDKYLPYSLLIDYSEISTIINWIETIKDEINNNSEIVYLSYSPKDTGFTFYIDKYINSYSLNIQYYDFWFANEELIRISYSSKDGYDFKRLNKFQNQLMQIQKEIDERFQ